MKDKFYSKEKALDAMFELRRQGFTSIIIQIIGGGKSNKAEALFLGCNDQQDYSKECYPPDIEIDNTESWSNTGRSNSFYGTALPKRDYWWIFD